MKAIPPIKAVMTPFPHWVEIDAPLDRARQLMAEKGFKHLPVMEQGKLVGVLTERQLPPAPGPPGTVRDVFVRETYVVGLSEPLDKVLEHMAEHHLESALVMKDGKLAGIFTTSDACRSFARLLGSLFPGGGSSDAA